MHEYKIIKDFPSRNGVKHYKAGNTVVLGWNSRTKALIGMGFIRHISAFKNNVRIDIGSCSLETLIDKYGNMTFNEVLQKHIEEEVCASQ